MKKSLSWFLRLLKNMGSSRISGVCVKVLIGPAACCLEKEWFPSCERSVQSCLLSSGGAGSAPLHGWVRGQQQQGGDARQKCSSHHGHRPCQGGNLPGESWKENWVLHFRPGKLLWIHLIKQNISFYCFNNKSYILNKCNICNTIKM